MSASVKFYLVIFINGEFLSEIMLSSQVIAMHTMSELDSIHSSSDFGRRLLALKWRGWILVTLFEVLPPLG